MAKRLTGRQQAVINELFKAEMHETDVLKKYRLSTSIYRKWLEDERFTAELAFRCQSARRQTDMILTKFAPAAAAKLVSLTQSDKDETVRKACLDIISMPAVPKSIEDAQPKPANEPVEKLSPELASKLLETLAKEK